MNNVFILFFSIIFTSKINKWEKNNFEKDFILKFTFSWPSKQPMEDLIIFIIC